MLSSQISKALLSDPHVSKYFAGVFARDKLPTSITYPCYLVANTHPSTKKGEHWVAFHFDSKGNGEYFDSYGKTPCKSELLSFLLMNGMTYMWNDTPLQGLASTVCGQYCIAYLSKRASGDSMYDIIRCYKGQIPGDKDTKMALDVNKHFNIQTVQHGSGVNNPSGEQCCCSKVECRSHYRLKQAEMEMTGEGDGASFLI
jgi:hypothetical protein